jgi:hypothetical protein
VERQVDNSGPWAPLSTFGTPAPITAVIEKYRRALLWCYAYVVREEKVDRGVRRYFSG